MDSVLTAWTRMIVDYAARRGLSEAALCASAAVAPELLAEPRVSGEVNHRLWTTAADELAEPALSLRLSQSELSLRALGIVGTLARTSPTVEHALVLGARYHRIIKAQGELKLERRSDRLVIHDGPAPTGGQQGWPHAMAETVIANYVTLARRWTGAGVTPLEVTFQHARPDGSRDLEQFFGCPVRFAQPTNSLALSRDALALPLTTWSPELARLLDENARRELAALGRDGLGDVLAAISALLERGELEVAAVARELATSSRSLQRRLAERNTTFRALVDSARSQRAVALLQAGLSLDDIAAQLGFSDERALRRALRRWTGRTAREVSASAPQESAAA